jgi:hypothetical protein
VACAQRQNQRERAGPEGGGEARGPVGPVNIARGICGARDVDNERVEARAAFGGIDARHSRAIAGVCTEAIDRFCGQRDTPARAQEGGGLGYACGIGGKKVGF